MKKVAPHSVFLETSGDSGGLVFNIPFDHVKELGHIFSLLDKEIAASESKELGRLRQLVTDVGVSQTSLEEVFMVVSNFD